MTDALGQTTTYQRGAATNLVQSVTDALGRVTSYTYVRQRADGDRLTTPAVCVLENERGP